MAEGVVSLQNQIRLYLETAVAESKAPGAVAYVGDLEHTHAHVAIGVRQLKPKVLPAEPDTIYDLASVTKVMATATAIMLLNESGAVDLDAPVSSVLPFPAFSAITSKHCLTHTAGLNPGRPFYKDCNTIDAMLERYAAMPLSWPAGSRWLYSDVGYMILGRVVETVSKQNLDVFCASQIFQPLKMKNTMFNPPATWADRCAATEDSEWRGKIMLGQVHDENAYAVGGVAGHAGLFSNATDMALFARALLNGSILKPATVERMCTLGLMPAWPWQGLGWQLDPWPTKTFGFLPARNAIGHAGWTGTSMWIDRQTARFAILLSNTCHPSRATRDNETLRRTFYSGIGKTYYTASANVHTGLDRLVREDFDAVRGKRIGLLTHHAAVDQFGRHILDVLAMAPDARIVRAFSPEHGLRGQAEAGASVGAQDANVPVVSLYGARKEPTEAELRGIDLFVIDLQDVGARYYTYPATMKACLRACAKAGVPILVLDRPNPVGGATLEGPVALDTESLVCWGTVPIRHGMTMGEIAQFFCTTELKELKPDLRVNRIDSWTPERLFSECSLPWISPSPNIPTAETALIYVGTCLFEGTNVSEGRGTDAPFATIGAPWFDAREIISAVSPALSAGLTIEPISFTPRSIEGKAAKPKYKDESCTGLRITVTNGRAARPFGLAVGLLSALYRRHGRELQWEKSFDVLAGTPDLRAQIEGGQTAEKILANLAPVTASFELVRPKLYSDPPQTTP